MREAREELGPPMARAELLGPLSSIPLFTSEFRIHPFVALVEMKPGEALTPEPGAVGKASVFAASVSYDRSCEPSDLESDQVACWTADDSRFDTAGAFHLADEMIWFHDDEVSGFPNF